MVPGVLDAAGVEYYRMLARLLLALVIATVPLMTAGFPVAAQQSGSLQPGSVRKFSPSPRNVHVTPSTRPAHRNASGNQHSTVNPYQPQPYLMLDPSTVNKLLATSAPHPTPKPQAKRPSSGPTPEMFEHYDTRGSL
jgi:hypothetical protein